MSTTSLIRRLTRPFVRMLEALPPFPRIPTPKRVVAWWRNYRNNELSFPRPHFPSREDIAAWWHERRGQDFLPNLPRAPSPKEITQWLHEAPNLPQLPSPQKSAAWFREHPGRRKTVLWWTIALVAIVLLAGTAPRASRAIKRWQAQRLTKQALIFIEQQRWPEAAIKIRDAFQLRPTEVETWRANARLLSRTGRGAPAVEWWAKISQSRSLSIEDRRDYAEAALSVNELALASEQVNAIFSQHQTPSLTDVLLQAQLAVLRGDNRAGLEYAKRVLADLHTTPHQALLANLVVIAATPQDSPEFVEAASRLVEVARQPPDSVSLDALTVLARQLSAKPPTKGADQPLSIPLPQFSSSTISALEIADRLEQHPGARAYQKMLALEMRARADPGHEDDLVAKAIQVYGSSDDETIAAIGAWLYQRGRFDAMLQILPLDRAARNRDLLIERIDALAALGRLAELEEMLLTEYPVLPQAFQHMYLAVVRSRLGEKAATANEWERALDVADTTQNLLAFADYAEKNGPLEIAEAAYNRAITKEPGLRSAYVARLRLLELIGPTAKAHELAKEMIRLWPDDTGTRMHEVYLRLLLGPSEGELQAAEKEAAAAISKNPWDGIARSIVALVRLKQGRTSSALEILSDPEIGLPASKISWPVYIAALAANGWKDKARVEAKKLAAVRLLPEERSLIAPALAE